MELLCFSAFDKEDAYLKMARVEYRDEYRSLSKSLGRNPTGREVKDIILSR
jgi:hypothetical protein